MPSAQARRFRSAPAVAVQSSIALTIFLPYDRLDDCFTVTGDGRPVSGSSWGSAAKDLAQMGA
jgi:hypothetical protein